MPHSVDGAAAENMLQAAYLTIGKLAPDYENVELSVGGSTVAAAVVEATGNPTLAVKSFSCVDFGHGSSRLLTKAVACVFLQHMCCAMHSRQLRLHPLSAYMHEHTQLLCF